MLYLTGRDMMQGGWPLPGKGGDAMTIFEVLTLMLGFGMFVIALFNAKK